MHVRKSSFLHAATLCLALAALLAVASQPEAPVLAAGTTNLVTPALPLIVRTNGRYQPDDIVARVNGRELRWAAMDMAASNMLSDVQGGQATTVSKGKEDEALQFYRRKAVLTFIDRTLLYEEAKRRGITVTPSERSNATSRVEALLQPRGFKSMEEFFATSPLGATGIQRDFEETLYTEKLLEETVRNVITVQDVDRERMLQEINAKRAEGRQKIEALRDKLLAGADFAALARESSDHPSKAAGGDLGEFARGRLGDAALEAAAFNQPTNAIGPMVETKLGYVIVQATAHTPAQPAVGNKPARPESARFRVILVRVPPVLAAEDLDREVKRRKYDAAFKSVLRTLRRPAKIETIYPELR